MSTAFSLLIDAGLAVLIAANVWLDRKLRVVPPRAQAYGLTAGWLAIAIAAAVLGFWVLLAVGVVGVVAQLYLQWWRSKQPVCSTCGMIAEHRGVHRASR